MIMVKLGTVVILMSSWSIYKIHGFLNRNQFKLAVLYGCLMGMCIILCALQIAQVNIPSTATIARIIFEPIGKFILKQWN
ncbi:hypothetical protein [Paenibacillus sp. NPDC058071]|uniref:hypothetical protein n=1 Tax=Paenibacillus sp. NPDC058071 TaxID=3346326 RepID=UPI0036DA694D